MTVQMLTLIAMWCGTMSGVGPDDNGKVRQCRNRIIACQGATSALASVGIEGANIACFSNETKTSSLVKKK